MEQALTQNISWEAIHGPHQVPKQYVPPFLQQEEEKKKNPADELDNLYEIEIEGYDLRESKEIQQQNTFNH